MLSTFGVMFTADQDKAAAELLRVCKSGGKIGLANWTPEGFIGQLFKTLGKHLPPPAGVKSPALWGTRARLNEMFGQQASGIVAEPRMFVFRYRSPQHWLDVFKTFYGPMLKAYAALDAERAGGADPRPLRADRRVQLRRATARWRCAANTSRSSSPSAEAFAANQLPARQPGFRSARIRAACCCSRYLPGLRLNVPWPLRSRFSIVTAIAF